MFGWTITASQIAFMTEFLLAIKVIFDNSWVGAGQGWTQFVLYLGINFFVHSCELGCMPEGSYPVLI